MNNCIKIPQIVRRFLRREYGVEVGRSILRPVIPHGHETGGIITPALVVIELPNDTPLSPRNHYHPAIEQAGEEVVLGIWHTHWNDKPPSVRDQKAARIWATEDGVPLFAVFSDTQEWWFVDGELAP